MPDELESLFNDEEDDDLKRAERASPSYKEIRSCILPPPLNPLTQQRCWNPKQIEVIKAPATYVDFFGGVGSGKSIILVHDMLIKAAFNTHEEGMLAAPIAKNITGNLYPYVRQALRDFQEFNGLKLERRWWKTDKVLELINGFRVNFRTLSEPESLRGPSLSVCGIDEFAKASDICAIDEDELLDIVIGRMRGGPNTRWMRCLLANTPCGLKGAAAHWVRKIRARDPDYKIISSASTENCALRASYLQGMASRYSDKFYQQEVLGLLIDMSDAYFSDVIHPVESFIDFAVRDNEPLDIGIDWGVVHPVAVFSQEWLSPDGPADVITSSISNRSTNDDLIEAIVERIARYGVKRIRLYPDPADAEAIRDLKRQMNGKCGHLDWEIHYTRKFTNRSFSFSIQKLHDRFRTKDGHRRIYFRKGLPTEPTKADPMPVAWCFQNYRIDPNTGKAPAKSLHKHHVDATRYIHINKYFKGSADEE